MGLQRQAALFLSKDQKPGDTTGEGFKTTSGTWQSKTLTPWLASADHLPASGVMPGFLTGDRHAADDVQDTLERGWAKFSLWRPGSRLDAWVPHHHAQFVCQPVPGAGRLPNPLTNFMSNPRCALLRQTG